MYVSIFICMHLCVPLVNIWVCAYESVCICAFLCVYLYVHLCVYVCITCVHIWVCVSLFLCIFVCMCILLVCIYMCIWVMMHLYAYLSFSASAWMYIPMCICVPCMFMHQVGVNRCISKQICIDIYVLIYISVSVYFHLQAALAPTKLLSGDHLGVRNGFITTNLG